MGGPVEEAGKFAGGIVEALKAQPAVLALTVANIGMMLFIYYALHAAASFRDRMLTEERAYHSEVAQLLAKCVIPDRQTTKPLFRPRPAAVKPPPVEDDKEKPRGDINDGKTGGKD